MFDITSLLTQLNQSGLQTSNPPLYQFLSKLIKGLNQNQAATNAAINSGGNSGIINKHYLTSTDESADLPDSRQLLAGTGISFDDSIANERTINAESVGTWDVLTDGDLVEPELIYANGEVIMLHIL